MSATTKLDALDQLKSGIKELTQSDEWLRFLDVQRKLYRYSWGNCILISRQCPDATNVAGYHRWRELGRQVKKGEKGIMILAPIIFRKKADQDADEEAEAGSVAAFRTAFVFDVSQTEGEPLPQVCDRLSGDEPPRAFEQLKAVAANAGFNVEVVRLDGELNGDCSHDRHLIRVSSERAPAQQVKTLAHEIAHALLHSPEQRPPGAERGLLELEAESVAFVVCSNLGLDSGAYSFGYVANWAGAGDAASAAISSSAERINQAARRILESLSGCDAVLS